MNFLNEYIIKFTEWLNYISGGNEFLAGTIVLAITGYLYLLKSVPSKIYNYIYRRVTTIVYVNNISPITHSGASNAVLGPESIAKWHKKHWFYRFVRRTEYIALTGMNFPMGTYFTYFKGGFYKLSYNTKILEGNSSPHAPPKSIEVTILKFGFTPVSDIVDMINKEIKILKEEKSPPRLYNPNKGSGNCRGSRKIKNSPIIQTEENLRFLNEIEKFISNKKWYEEKYLSYKESFLLYGESGTGKSSIVRQVGDKLGLDIIQVNMSDLKNFTTSTIESTLVAINEYDRLERPAILLFEDIDTLGSGVSQRKDDDVNDSNFTLSELLNLFDGVSSVENVIIVMTTNYIKNLDEALIRRGRANHKIEFKKFDENDIKTFIDIHFPNDEFDESKLNGLELKIADIGNIYVQNPHDVNQFIQELNNIYKENK